MEQLNKQLEALRLEIDKATARIELPAKQKELEELNEQISQTDFWKDTKRAQEITKEQSNLETRIQPWIDLKRAVDEVAELAALGDSKMLAELQKQADKAQLDLDALKKELRFSGPYDDHDVILSIYAGAGGTDAQDWAQILLRMYTRWAEANKLNVKTLDQSSGEEAGIKSVELEISGDNFLYGKLAGEHGVHRLVRLSPFNSNNLRQTSFAKVEVLPLIDKPNEVELDEKDLKIDVFRAGGHGGQSVNTTDSAVRVTHLPTGITVAIQNERSQLQNKETALNIVRSKLVQLKLEQHAEDLSKIKGPSQSAEWGNQIRNYVLHPYKQVKDTRTSYESSDVEKVLDGSLDPLIDAWLENRPA